MNKINRKIWLGITSLVLFILGILFGVSFGGKPSYGDLIFNFIGLKPWSKVNTGLHYTGLIALIFLIPAFVFGYNFLKETLELEKMNGLRRIDTLECKLSIVIVLITSFVLPGKITQDGGLIVEHAFGFPFNYWFIYQENRGSLQLLSNLFNGNKGMNINVINLFINIVILYYGILIIKKIYMKVYVAYKK